MNRKLALTFLLVTVAIDSIGIGLIIPVMPDLLLEIGGESVPQAAAWGGVLASTFAVLQFICGPTIGSLSDRYGRRPVLLLALFFLAIDYVIMGFAHAFWLLIVGRIIGGITSSTQATAAAYVSDISRPEDKARGFGLIGAAFGIGFILGPLLGGVFAEFGTRAPFFAAAFLSFANMLFGLLVLPETVTDEIRRPFDWKRANPLGGFYHVGRLPGLSALLVIFFVYSFAFTVYPAIWPYFTVERFGWEPRMIGVSLALFGVGIALVQGVIIRYFLNFLGEVRTALAGMTFNILGFLGYAFATDTWMAIALIPVSAMGAVVVPAIQGVMARLALPNQQGELQGVISSVNAIAFAISPLVMTQIFNGFAKPGTGLYFPGAPFIVSLGLTLLAMGMLLHFRKQSPDISL